MVHYSVQPGDRISVKGYEFLFFAKNTGKNIGKNISNYLSGKCSQKRFDQAKKFPTDAFKTTSKRVIQKTAEANGDLIGNTIANTVIKAAKNSQQNNSERVTYENDKEILKERYISPEERQNIIDTLRLILII